MSPAEMDALATHISITHQGVLLGIALCAVVTLVKRVLNARGGAR